MATLPTPAVEPGTFIYIEGYLCYAENITNSPGYNIYHTVEVDTENKHQKSWHEIEIPDFTLLNIHMEEILEDIKDDSQTENTEKKPVPTRESLWTWLLKNLTKLYRTGQAKIQEIRPNGQFWSLMVRCGFVNI